MFYAKIKNAEPPMTITNPQLTFITSIKKKIRLAQYEVLREYHEYVFLQPLVAEIDWAKRIAIMS